MRYLSKPVLFVAICFLACLTSCAGSTGGSSDSEAANSEEILPLNQAVGKPADHAVVKEPSQARTESKENKEIVVRQKRKKHFLVSAKKILQDESKKHLAILINKRVKRLGLNTSANRELCLLQPPMFFPSVASIPKLSDDPLHKLWSVPVVKDGSVVSFSNNSIEERLREYFQGDASIIRGEVQPTDAQKQKLSDSVSVLYLDPDNRKERTPAYKAYLEFQKKKRETEKAIDEATDDGEKLDLSSELDSLIEAYQIQWLDAETKIETAKRFVASFVSNKTILKPLLEVMDGSISEDAEAESHKTFYATVSSENWSSMQISGGDLPETVELLLSGEIVSVHIRSFAFEFRVSPIEHPALSTGLLKNRYWKHRDGAVISSANANPDESEVAPRYISDVVMVRNVTIGFSEDDVAAVEGKLESATRAGGIPISKNGPGSAYLMPGKLVIGRPFVLSAVVSHTSKSPNPAEMVKWLDDE